MLRITINIKKVLVRQQKCFFTSNTQQTQINKIHQILNNNSAKNKSLHLKEINENPNAGSSTYFDLSICLNDNEVVELNNGSKFNKEKLLLKSIDMEPNANSYHNLAYLIDDTNKINGDNNNNNSKSTIQLLNGEKLTKKDLYLRSIDLNSKHSIAYNNLANLLNQLNEKSITLLDGTVMNRKQLYLKSIEIDPIFSKSYHNLANQLNSANEEVTLSDGTKMNRRQLYLKSVDLQPNTSNSYFNLASQLDTPKENSITLLNGKTMTDFELYIKSIDVNPNLKSTSYSFNNLANLLEQHQQKHQQQNKHQHQNQQQHQQQQEITITLLDGKKLNKKQLYCKAIELDNRNVEAYYNLAVALKPDESISVGGKNVNKMDLYIKLLELEPNYDSTYYNLAVNLKPNESITLENNNNKTMSQIDLILKAIDLNPNQPLFYRFLFKLLSLNNGNGNDFSIKLFNGKSLSKQDLRVLSNLNETEEITQNNNNTGILSKLKNLFFK